MIDLGKFSRVTSSRTFIPEVDGLRFIAISTVVLFHLRTSVLRSGGFVEASLNGGIFFDVLTQGGLGVNLFFTISGFILALPFARSHFEGQQPVVLSKYYMRRLTRLEPPYIIVMTFIFFGLVFSNSFNYLLPHYLTSLGYIHYFVYGEWSTINPVAWSLETEVQFYLLAPLVALVFVIRNHRLRYILYFVIIVFHALFVASTTKWMIEHHLVKSILFYFSNFFIGFVLADIFLRSNILSAQRRSRFNDVLGAVGLIGMYCTYFDPRPVFALLFYLSTGLLFVGAFCGKWFNLVLSYKPITVIGGMCYTIYLIHYVFIFVVWGELHKLVAILLPTQFLGQYVVAAILVLPALVVVSALLFITIEKPFMYPDWAVRFRKQFSR